MSTTNEATQALRNIFPLFSENFPDILKNELELLISRSRYLVPHLKPDEESARSMICALLAFERVERRVQDVMFGQIPNAQRISLPPSRFKSLAAHFRSSLFPDEVLSEPLIKLNSPKKQRNLSSPRKRNTSTIEGIVTVSPKKRNIQSSSNSFEFSSIDNDVSSRDTRIKNKRVTKTSLVKGGNKASDPTKQQVISLCGQLGITDNVTSAILKSYRIYNNLVKDKWGLLCGIIVIIISKAQPAIIEGKTQYIYSKLILLTKVDQLRLDEWIKWAASIINDQSWIKKVTNPNAKGIVFKKEYKKYSSGIGNMISGTMSFTNISRIEDYHEWKREIQDNVFLDANILRVAGVAPDLVEKFLAGFEHQHEGYQILNAVRLALSVNLLRSNPDDLFPRVVPEEFEMDEFDGSEDVA